jgi:hypothetical protein
MTPLTISIAAATPGSLCRLMAGPSHIASIVATAAISLIVASVLTLVTSPQSTPAREPAATAEPAAPSPAVKAQPPSLPGTTPRPAKPAPPIDDVLELDDLPPTITKRRD